MRAGRRLDEGDYDGGMTYPNNPPPESPPQQSAPRQPDWRPPRNDPGRGASIVGGLIMVGIGLWFFASQTLGIDLPRIDWRQAWPLILIAIGAWIVLGSLRRRR